MLLQNKGKLQGKTNVYKDLSYKKWVKDKAPR
jgi:hypothetical protein